MTKTRFILFLFVAGLLGTIGSGCGFDCKSACMENVYVLWDVSSGVSVGPSTCRVKEVRDADSCEKCDAALAQEAGAPLAKSTCDDD